MPPKPQNKNKQKLSELPALPAPPPAKDASASTQTSKPRFTTPKDYAMNIASPSSVVSQPIQSKGPLTLSSPTKSWSELVEAESELQDAQTQSFSEADMEKWCQLMGFLRQVKPSDPQTVVASSPTPAPVVASCSTAPTQGTKHLASSQSQSLETKPIPSRFSSSSEPAYLKTSRIVKLLQMEPEYWDPNPQKAARQLLGPDANFVQKTPQFTQKYYEFILVDTNSVSLNPHKDKKTSSIVSNTSVQIHSILSPTEWKIHPKTVKQFSQPFIPSVYNYWDYQTAWVNTFTFQNSLQNHSWFFYFNRKKPIQVTFPHWFLNQWWPCYGPTLDILPPPVREGFDYFSQRFQPPPNSAVPLLLYFFSIFKLAWIYSQKFAYHKEADSVGLPLLVLQGQSKWWKDWNADNTFPSAIQLWFKTNPQYLSPTDTQQTTFLQQKSVAAATLAAAASKEDFLQVMEKLVQQLKKDEDSTAPTDEAFSAQRVQTSQEDQEDQDYYFE